MKEGDVAMRDVVEFWKMYAPDFVEFMCRSNAHFIKGVVWSASGLSVYCLKKWHLALGWWAN